MSDSGNRVSLFLSTNNPTSHAAYKKMLNKDVFQKKGRNQFDSNDFKSNLYSSVSYRGSYKTTKVSIPSNELLSNKTSYPFNQQHDRFSWQTSVNDYQMLIKNQKPVHSKKPDKSTSIIASNLPLNDKIFKNKRHFKASTKCEINNTMEWPRKGSVVIAIEDREYCDASIKSLLDRTPLCVKQRGKRIFNEMKKGRELFCFDPLKEQKGIDSERTVLMPSGERFKRSLGYPHGGEYRNKSQVFVYGERDRRLNRYNSIGSMRGGRSGVDSHDVKAHDKSSSKRIVKEVQQFRFGSSLV